MSEYVVREVMTDLGWHQVGALLSPGAPDSPLQIASFSLNDERGFRVLFGYGFEGDEAGVWRSVRGVDHAFDAVDAIGTLGMEKVSDLTEPFAFPYKWRGRFESRARVPGRG